jgi:hypothetical protein
MKKSTIYLAAFFLPLYRDAPTEGALELGEWTIKQTGHGVLVSPAYAQEATAYPNKLSSTITYKKQ